MKKDGKGQSICGQNCHFTHVMIKCLGDRIRCKGDAVTLAADAKHTLIHPSLGLSAVCRLLDKIQDLFRKCGISHGPSY